MVARINLLTANVAVLLGMIVSLLANNIAHKGELRELSNLKSSNLIISSDLIYADGMSPIARVVIGSLHG